MSKRKPRKTKARPGDTHVFRCGGGTLTARIVECPDHIHVVIGGRHDGPMSAGMDREYERWMLPLVEKYEDDPRPLWIDHTDGNRRAFVHKLAGGRVLAAMATKVE